MTDDTISRQLVIRAWIGRTVQLGLYETIGQVKVTDNPDYPESPTITVLVNAVKWERNFGCDEILATGLRLHQFTWNGDSYHEMRTPTLWDESPTHSATLVRNFGSGKSPAEHREQAVWEDSCYRPGTRRSPLDNVAVRSQLKEMRNT